MSVRDLLLPSFLALALGAGTAGLVACGDDGDGANLIPSRDAEAIIAELTSARDALAGGECTAASEATDRVRSSIDALPSSVDRRLRSRLREGARELEQRIGPDCEEQTQSETVPTVTTTVPETTTTEPETTTTETTTTETEPPPATEPPATEPPATEPPTTEPQDGTGGFTPDLGDGT